MFSENLQNHIIEINDLVNTLSDKEKKAVRNFISQHYDMSKEFKFFQLVCAGRYKTERSKYRKIKELGYGESNEISLIKLKNRTKEKILDYLCSNLSIEELKSLNSNLFHRQKIKKLIIQFSILYEKNLVSQAWELLDRLYKYAIDNERIHEMPEILELKRYISTEDYSNSNGHFSIKKEESIAGLKMLIDEVGNETTVRSECKTRIDQFISTHPDIMEVFPHFNKYLRLISELFAFSNSKNFHRTLAVIKLYRFVTANSSHQSPRTRFFVCKELCSDLCEAMHPVFAFRIISNDLKLISNEGDRYRLRKVILEHGIRHHDKVIVEMTFSTMIKAIPAHPEFTHEINFYKPFISFILGGQKQALKEIQLIMNDFRSDENRFMDLRFMEVLCLLKLQLYDILELRMECISKLLRARKVNKENYLFSIFNILKEMYQIKTNSIQVRHNGNFHANVVDVSAPDQIGHFLSSIFIAKELPAMRDAKNIAHFERTFVPYLNA